MDIVYLITNKTKNKFYVGSKKSWLGEGTYWGSPSAKEYHDDFKTDEFTFEILFEVEPDENIPKKLLHEEIEELKRRNVLKDTSYYNKCIPDVGFSTLGDKRPGVGGVKKGSIPWNKGREGYTRTLSPNEAMSRKKNFKKKHGHHFDRLVKLYESRPELEQEGKIQANGVVMTYDRIFSNIFYEDFLFTTPVGFYNMIVRIEELKGVMNELR